MRRLISLFIVITSLVLSCDESKTSNYDVSINNVRESNEHPGKKLMETFCFTCHMPPGSISHDNRLGPPMKAVKMHYKRDGVSKEEFINNIQQWIKNPTEENVKLHGAFEKFGLMPPLPLPDETSKQIADYIFDHDVSHYENKNNYKF